MKNFSKYWISSKKPKKQRKYRANAPHHLKRKLISANLSKELRKTQNRRSLVLRKKDTVKIMRGSFKRKTGKIVGIDVKNKKVFIENIQKTKKDGTKISIPFDASNLQIIELDLEDKKRLNKNKQNKKTVEPKKNPKNKSEAQTQNKT